jgi:hypothetical protein
MTYKFLSKKGPTLAFALFVVCVVIAMIPILSGLEEFSVLPTESQSFSEEGKIFLPGIYLSVALLAIATIVAIVLSFVQVLSNPKESIKALISFGVLAILFFLLYSMADAKGSGSLALTLEKFNVGDGVSKLVGGGITLTVILLLGSVIVTILMEIWNFFKNQ